MASAVTYADGTIRGDGLTPESNIQVWVSPATMDSNDTVIVPTITGRTLRILSCWDNTTGDAVTASISSFTVTIDAAGGTTDHEYVLMFTYI